MDDGPSWKRDDDEDDFGLTIVLQEKTLNIFYLLHSDVCDELQKSKAHLFFVRVSIGRSGSSKVDDFVTNQRGPLAGNFAYPFHIWRSLFECSF